MSQKTIQEVLSAAYDSATSSLKTIGIVGSTAQALGIDAVGADAYATVVTPSADATHIKVNLDGSNDAIISLDAGTTDHIYITAGEVATLDQIAITSGTAIQAKNATPGSNYTNLTITIW